MINPEVGVGSLLVQLLVYRLISRNGLITADHSRRKMHVGRLKKSKNEAVTPSSNVVESAVSEVTLRQLVEPMLRTLGIAFVGDPVIAISSAFPEMRGQDT